MDENFNPDDFVELPPGMKITAIKKTAVEYPSHFEDMTFDEVEGFVNDNGRLPPSGLLWDLVAHGGGHVNAVINVVTLLELVELVTAYGLTIETSDLVDELPIRGNPDADEFVAVRQHRDSVDLFDRSLVRQREFEIAMNWLSNDSNPNHWATDINDEYWFKTFTAIHGGKP